MLVPIFSLVSGACFLDNHKVSIILVLVIVASIAQESTEIFKAEGAMDCCLCASNPHRCARLCSQFRHTSHFQFHAVQLEKPELN